MKSFGIQGYVLNVDIRPDESGDDVIQIDIKKFDKQGFKHIPIRRLKVYVDENN